MTDPTVWREYTNCISSDSDGKKQHNASTKNLRPRKRTYMKDMKSTKDPERKQYLKSHNWGSDVSPVTVLFLSDFNYKQIEDKIDLEEYSIIEILKQCFAFACSNDRISDNDPNKDKKEEEITWRNKKIDDIYSNDLEEVEILRWLKENDNLDLKHDTKEKLEETFKSYFSNIHNFRGKKFATAIHMLYLLKREVDTGFRFHDRVKSIFYYISSLLNICVLQNGAAVHDIRIYVPTCKASDDSNIFTDRTTTFRIKPDTVYLVPDARHCGFSAKFVAEVYAPKDGESDVEDENEEKCGDVIVEEKDHGDKSSTSDCKSKDSHISCEGSSKRRRKSSLEGLGKPIGSQNKISCQNYQTQAREYIKQSLPLECRDGHCMKKMAGQHVLQLLSLATLMQDNNIIQDKYMILGCFLRNEYLYFSKLTVSNTKLISLARGETSEEKFAITPRKDDFGEVEYSNWHLDLTKPNHRLALMLFLYEYLV